MRLTFIFMLFTSALLAQKNRIDVGGGDSDKVKLAILILNKIEKNQELEIGNYFLNEGDFQEKEWDKYIQLIQSDFPNSDNSVPTSDVTPGKKLWYERTYFEEMDNEIKYHFQIYFELIESNSKIKIKKLIFKEGDEIINRDKEIERLGDRYVPPPPPAFSDF